MKLIKRNISHKDGSGTILLRPETSEDLWSIYNIIQKNDLVRCTTLRKVVNVGSTGSTTSSKKRMQLTIHVDKIDFDPNVLQLRLSGKTTSENNNVRLGSYHTLTIELNQNFTIEKECWDIIYIEKLDEACNPENSASLVAITMELGLAHICVVVGSLTITKARIEVNIPKKRSGFTSKHTSAINKFYEAIYQGIIRHVDFNQIKCVLLASPGYVKDDFYSYMMTESVKKEDRVIIENKSKFILCKSSSGHKHALEEVFTNMDILNQIEDTKVAKEYTLLKKFLRMIDINPNQAYYGYKSVLKANENLAIESLLITDELFRSSCVRTRKKYVNLVESVRNNGGNVYIFSSMHISGKQLQQVSGIAAILRYPLPDLDELSESDESDNDDNESDNEQKQEDVNRIIEEQADTDDDNDDDNEKRLREDMEDMGF